MDDDWTPARGAVLRLENKTAWDFVAPNTGRGLAAVDGNLDGRPDLAIGVPYWAPDHSDPDIPGATFLVEVGGLFRLEDDDLAVRDHAYGTVFAEAGQYRFGHNISAQGDLTADGSPQILISGWHLNRPLLGEFSVQEDFSWAFATAGDSGVDDFGSTDCGDLNGDGYDDLCVAPMGIYHGPLLRETVPADVALGLGTEFIHSGQIMPDGPKSVVGGYDTVGNNAGVVHIWHPDGTGGYDGPVEITGEAEQDKIGNWLSIGQLSGDGTGGLFIASLLANDRLGRAYLWPDGTVGGRIGEAEVQFQPRYPEDAFGRDSVIADFDGDGQADLAVAICGGILLNGRAGRVAVYRGPFAPGIYTEADADVIWYGSGRPDDNFGLTLVAADFDGDGAAELAVGAPEDPLVTEHGGAVYLIDDALTP